MNSHKCTAKVNLTPNRSWYAVVKQCNCDAEYVCKVIPKKHRIKQCPEVLYRCAKHKNKGTVSLQIVSSELINNDA